MQVKFELQLEVSQLPSQPIPQHQCQQYALVFGGGHVVQHVIHAASYNCHPLHDCMEQVNDYPVVLTHKEPASRL